VRYGLLISFFMGISSLPFATNKPWTAKCAKDREAREEKHHG
jgi:hypothetical protein